MANCSKCSLKNNCEHSDVITGSRGANCMQCGCFLYSQTDNYKDKSAFICTVNYKDDQTMHDVVPFEYYNSLIKEEIFEQKTLKHKFCSQVVSVRKKLIDYIIELPREKGFGCHIDSVYVPVY